MRGVLRSLFVSLWFMALTFPLLVLRISPLDGSLEFRFANGIKLGIAVFALSFVWRALLVVKGISTREEADMEALFTFLSRKRNREYTLALAGVLFGCGGLYLAYRGAVADGGSVLLGLGLPAAAASFVVCAASLAGKEERLAALCRNTSNTLTRPGLPRTLILVLCLLLLLPLPFQVDIYQINVLTQTFIWIMLGLGLNIVVGNAGLLVLGYVAFYAVGAYSYAVLNSLYGNETIGFWLLLPLGGLSAALAGIALSLPVLRLRGDYLAIVTLGFGEIVRVVLEGGSVSLAPVAAIIELFTGAEAPAWLTEPLDLGGPAGISSIPPPTFFGTSFGLDGNIRYVYFVALIMTILTIFVVCRLRDSRLGRSWAALREDEIACEAMGINKVTAKLTAFALGACWAGFGGVLFAAKNTYINPGSFTFMESALILSVVVLGGLGSILGVILGACVFIVLPEYLRAFDEYRMLIFGASMVLMMVFRPQGLIAPKAKKRLLAGSASIGKKRSGAEATGAAPTESSVVPEVEVGRQEDSA